MVWHSLHGDLVSDTGVPGGKNSLCKAGYVKRMSRVVDAVTDYDDP
jgi:hypothetical protein